MAELESAQIERLMRKAEAQQASASGREDVILPPTIPRLLLMEMGDEGVVLMLGTTPTPEGEVPLRRGRALWRAPPLRERVRVATLTLSLLTPVLPLLRGRDREDALALVRRARAILRAAS